MDASFQLDGFEFRQLHDEIVRLEEYYGPEREVGPVIFEFGESLCRVFIGTQKDGNRSYIFDNFGILKEDI